MNNPIPLIIIILILSCTAAAIFLSIRNNRKKSDLLELQNAARKLVKEQNLNDSLLDIPAWKRKGRLRMIVALSWKDKEKESLYDISESDGNLTIERRKDEGFHIFQIDFTDRKMVITVPEDFKGYLNVTNTSGTVQMDNIDAEQVSIKNSSGSIKLKDVSVEGDLGVKNTSGSVKLTDVEAGGNVKAENTSGSIKFENLKSGGDISLETTSGSVKGTIDGKESDYRIRSSVSSGSCNLKDSDEGDKELNAHVTSGSIKINFTE